MLHALNAAGGRGHSGSMRDSTEGEWVDSLRCWDERLRYFCKLGMYSDSAQVMLGRKSKDRALDASSLSSRQHA